MSTTQRLFAAADRLQALLDAATPGPWTVTDLSSRYGGLVGPVRDSTPPDEPEGYGGELVAESVSPANRVLLATLRDLAPAIVASLRAAALRITPDGDVHPFTADILKAIEGTTGGGR